jgi:uncharacterized membrane protein
MDDWLTTLFGLVCGQLPAHTSAPGGIPLPFCQRCTGLYAGAAVAAALHVALRIRASERFLQLHGGLLLLMVPLGFHWLPQDELVRMTSGVVFGAGVVAYLWLTAAPRLLALRPLSRTGSWIYAAGITATLAVVPAAALFGAAAAWDTLVLLALTGAAALALLVSLNLALAAAWLWNQLCLLSAPPSALVPDARTAAARAARGRYRPGSGP